MADHLLEDFHVGGGVMTGDSWSKTTHMGGAVDGSKQLFANNTNWHEGSCNLETNAGIHTMWRALMEGADLNDFFKQFIPSTSNDTTSRIKLRTASFCTERSGYSEGGANDQGLSFYLPNMSWIQPPGYVHKMVHNTWLPKAVAVSVSDACTLSVSAQMAEDSSSLRLIVVNNLTHTINASVSVVEWEAAQTANVTTLHASSLNATNPPSNPTLYSPKSSVVPWRGAYNYLPLSVTIIQLARAAVTPSVIPFIIQSNERGGFVN